MLTARLCPPFSRLERFVICAIANLLTCAVLLYFCPTDFICWEKPPRRLCALADLKSEWEAKMTVLSLQPAPRQTRGKDIVAVTPLLHSLVSKEKVRRTG